MSISRLGDLKQALITFDSNGRYSKRGPWSVANGGYDLWFEICYDNLPIVDCVDGELECLNDRITSDEYDAICRVVTGVMPRLHVSTYAFGDATPRYMALMGFNTKQLWIYDEQEDVYIDPPSGVLDALPEWDIYGGSEEAEEELARIANEERPDWLFDEDYWYDGDTDI